MSSAGKVQVVVRTRRVPVGTALVTTPLYIPSGVFVGSTTTRIVLYDTRLDETHRRAISEGRSLSCRLGLDLEVVDESKSGPFRRLISLVRRGASPEPAFLVAPQAGEDRGSPGLLPV
jgi:hypothetical protein